MKNNVTVGIPTYYGGKSLVGAVATVRKSVEKVDRVIVSVDGNPLEESISKQLKKLGAEEVFNEVRGGQVARIKQIVKMTNSKYIILTQDDVRLDPKTIKHIMDLFRSNPKVTMIGAKILPMKSVTFFEKIIEVGIRVNNKTGKKWENGDNYLLASGRCLAFLTSHAKKLEIPEEVINSDAYLYFENKRKGGTFMRAEKAIVYNKSPQNLKEHLKQSRKFQFSREELSRYFVGDLQDEYRVPKRELATVYLKELIKNPLFTLLYQFVYFYTRIAGKNMYAGATRFWATDVSTKKVL